MSSRLWFYDDAAQVWHLQRPGSYQNAGRTAVPLCGTTPLRTRRFQYGGNAGVRCSQCEIQQVVEEAEAGEGD